MTAKEGTDIDSGKREMRKPNAKSEWVTMALETDRHKAAVKSWFSPLCDDMEPLKAQVLVDIDTDREKKVRAWMKDAGGDTRLAIRTKTKAGCTVTLKARARTPAKEG